MITPGTIIGEYRIDGLLGRGGMAEVYKAWRMNLQRYEALKVLLPERAGDYSFAERFLKEARTVASLSHSNIAAVYTVSGENAPQPFFTMEMVEGINLSELIKKHGRLSLRQALPILGQVALALDYAHSRGLIHRDIKPANILLKREGNNYIVKVVDFGIAKAAEDSGNTQLTQMGTFVGTPEYISPEQANGAMVDGRTDQYSLAIMAYEMLCGEPPFKGGSGTSTISVITQHLRDTAVPPIQHNSELPLSANAAILQALSKDPNQRFSSCNDFIKAMKAPAPEVESEIKYKNSEISGGITTPLIKHRNPPLRLVIGIGGLALTGAVLVGAGLNRKSNQFPNPNTGLEQSVSSENSVNDVPSPTPDVTQEVTVPDLTGLKEDQAKDFLTAKDLGADTTTDYSETTPKGTIIRQYPAADASVAPGSIVRFAISLGPDPAIAAAEEQRQRAEEHAATAAAERPGILSTVENWAAAWERTDIGSYMANYTPDARIYGNKKWYSYDGFYQHESELFAYGGTISISRGNPTIHVDGNTATVRFSMTFQRWGGKSNYKSSGYQNFKMRKIDGSWMIYEDIFKK